MKKYLVHTLIFSLFLTASLPAQNIDKPFSRRTQTEPFRIGKGTSFSASIPRTGNNAGQRPERVDGSVVSQDVAEALELIQNYYVDGESADNVQLSKSSISSMLRTLDPHSNYFDSSEYSDLLSDQRSEYFGIGATIANFQTDGHLETYITSTFPDSPAFRANLGFGDKIIEVDGENVSRRNSLYVRNKVRGRKGSIVRFKVERNSTGRLETLVIRRNRVAQPSIPDAYMLRPGIAYIDLSQGFNYTTIEEMNVALDDLKRQGMKSLILDLRDNPGGILEQAIRVAEKFLPRGRTIATQRGRLIIDNRTWKSRNSDPEDYPLVVLVNDESASASEIVAGALQDYDRALIVGEKTFGKGLVQSVINLPYGAGLTLTTAKYYTPSGRLIQRDYSDGNLYDYYQHNEKSSGVGSKVAQRTLGGRPVYSGDGIAPDVEIEAANSTPFQTSLIDILFRYSRELAGGRIKGFESYRVDQQNDISKRIGPADFPISREVLSSFSEFSHLKGTELSTRTIDQESDFITLKLRYNLVSAAYGNVTAKQVLIDGDSQVIQAIQAIPRARKLANMTDSKTNISRFK